MAFDLLKLSNIMTSGFSELQQGYLQGFMDGVKVPFLGKTADGKFTGDSSSAEETVYGTEIEDLSREEEFKHQKNGLDCWDDMVKADSEKAFVKNADDIYRFKFYGMFYVSPAQDSYMCRMRIAGGELNTLQFRAIADMATEWGGGYADLTTRNNFQIREIMPGNVTKVFQRLTEIGITSKGSGADNIRNITATPTTGFDEHEFLDVMPYARSMHHYILNNRDLYGLPRKFNISFDSGGAISVCADTNDIGFYACKIEENSDGLEPGIYFRVQLCGITGHKQFASDCGILLKPEEMIPFAAGLMRVFIENGDRTNRKKSRLKYLVDDWGVEKMLAETDKKLATPLFYYPLEKCITSVNKVKHGHIGVHKQSDGNNYVGVVVPVGRILPEDMHKLADIVDKYGKSEVRLTVWQNLLVPHISDENLTPFLTELKAIGFQYENTAVSGGLIACTGSSGCKFAQAETKGQAVRLGKYLDKKVALEEPVNIHLTGCPHSCAQHYIGDIGMQGVKVKNEAGESVDGYNIVLGGGTDDDQYVAQEVFKQVAFENIPPLVESLLGAYTAKKTDGESFAHFTRRHSAEEIQTMVS